LVWKVSRDATHRICGVFACDRPFIPYLEANPESMSAVSVGGMPPAEPAESLQRFMDAGNIVAAIAAHDDFVDMDKPWHILEASHVRVECLATSITESRIHPAAPVYDGAEL
jgi:bifunctional UDP-N-acetylglucosamine pyrophosphorylase/glucosamine-1-phosphate N-acetyltransferase